MVYFKIGYCLVPVVGLYLTKENVFGHINGNKRGMA